MRFRYGSIAAAAGVAIAAALVLLGEQEEQPALSSPPAAPSITEAPAATPAAAPAPAVAVAAQPNPPAAPAASSESRAATIERLLASGTPADAYKAYQIAWPCVWARRMESLGKVGEQYGPRSAEACGDITPGQIVSRTIWLEKAAEAGVKDAFASWVNDSDRPREADGQVVMNPSPERLASDPVLAAWYEKQARFYNIAIHTAEIHGPEPGERAPVEREPAKGR